MGTPADTSRRVIALRFAAVGSLNTLVGLTAILLSRSLLGMPEVLANGFGYALGLMLSFVLNRRWTFGHAGTWHAAAVRFAIVVLGAWLLNVCCVLALLAIKVPAEFAHGAGVLPYAVATYWGCRAWVFAGEASRPAQPADRRNAVEARS